MERKLATVLFVDIVDSTRLVTGADPEVVRRRVTQFFETVSSCVEQHGGHRREVRRGRRHGGVRRARRRTRTTRSARRAALAMRAAVDAGLEARIGIEAGEVVVDDSESTFATGEAVNLAARLQEARVRERSSWARLPTGSRRDARRRGRRSARAQGHRRALRAWRVVDMLDGPGRPLGPRAPLVGREDELELLENTFKRSLRDSRAHSSRSTAKRVWGRAAWRASSSTAWSVRACSWAARCPTARASRTGRWARW